MKNWYHSKTLWINIIAIVAIALQAYFGFVIEPQDQVAILAVINLILRIITHEGLYERSKPEEPPTE